MDEPPTKKVDLASNSNADSPSLLGLDFKDRVLCLSFIPIRLRVIERVTPGLQFTEIGIFSTSRDFPWYRLLHRSFLSDAFSSPPPSSVVRCLFGYFQEDKFRRPLLVFKNIEFVGTSLAPHVKVKDVSVEEEEEAGGEDDEKTAAKMVTRYDLSLPRKYLLESLKVHLKRTAAELALIFPPSPPPMLQLRPVRLHLYGIVSLSSAFFHEFLTTSYLGISLDHLEHLRITFGAMLFDDGRTNQSRVVFDVIEVCKCCPELRILQIEAPVSSVSLVRVTGLHKLFRGMYDADPIVARICSKLVRLRLEGVGGGEAAHDWSAESARKGEAESELALRSLRFWMCGGVTEGFFDRLGHRCPYLNSLCVMSNSGLTWEGLCSFLKEAPSVRRVEVSSGMMYDDDVVEEVDATATAGGGGASSMKTAFAAPAVAVCDPPCMTVVSLKVFGTIRPLSKVHQVLDQISLGFPNLNTLLFPSTSIRQQQARDGPAASIDWQVISNRLPKLATLDLRSWGNFPIQYLTQANFPRLQTLFIWYRLSIDPFPQIKIRRLSMSCQGVPSNPDAFAAAVGAADIVHLEVIGSRLGLIDATQQQMILSAFQGNANLKTFQFGSMYLTK